MTPAVSVVMAAYNGARFVAETIDSVLAQSFADFELVIVDDASTDDTLAVLQAYTDPRIVVIASEANGGPVAARNRAFAAARGRYIVGLDQDDLCRPDRFARQVAYLDAHPEIVLVATTAAQLRDGEVTMPTLPETTPDLIDWLMLIQNPLAWSSVMFRGDAARALDPFERPEMLYVEDFDLYHRLRAHGRIARIDAPLITYRCHPGSASQRYETIMHANCKRVLTGAQATYLGDGAEAAAELILRYANAGEAVPDIATLARTIEAIGALRRGFAAERAPDAISLRLIDAEYARFWRFLVRVAVRDGGLRLRGALRTRPADIPARHVLVPGVWLSPLVARIKARRATSGRAAAWT